MSLQTDALGNKGCFYYGHGPANPSSDCAPETPLAGTTVYKNARGNKTTYFFDTSFRTTDIVDALAKETHFGYTGTCPAGNLCSVTDPLNHMTSFTYDSKGNALSVTNPLNKKWEFTYNTNNDILTETDPQEPTGRCTQYEYADGKNLTKITRYDRPCSDPARVEKARVTLGRSPSGNGDLVSITDGNNHTTAFTYDTRGLLDTVTDAMTPANVTNYDFDTAGRLTCLIDAEGSQTSFSYDAQNNIRFARDAENTDFVAGTCNLAGGGADNPTEYTYDEKGNRKTVKNARGKTTSFAYDKLDRLSSNTDPLLRATSFTYDQNGNLKTRVDPRSPSRTITYVYDTVDRLTNIQYPDFHLNASFAYYDDGLRQSMTDSTGTTSYEYFANQQLKKVTSPGNVVVQYEYDAVGNRKKITYPDPTKTVTYTYDELNRMKTVTDWLANVTTYAYDNAGNLDLATTDLAAAADNLTADPAYDPADRLDVLTNKRGATTLSSYDYALDKVGNRTQVVDTIGTTTYGYDDLYRLTNVTYPNSDAQVYTYDRAGNRLTKTHNGSPTSHIYDDADQMTRQCATTTCTPSTAGAEFGYEGNGALAYFGLNAFAGDTVVQQAQNGNNQYPLIDYEARYLRIGHCYDQYLGGSFDGAISVGDYANVVNAFGSSQGSSLYDPRKDTAPYSGPDGTITVADYSRVVQQFQAGEQCPTTGHAFYNGDGLRTQRWARPAPDQPMRRYDYVWDVGAGLPGVLEERVKDQAGNPIATYQYVYGLDLISRIDGTTSTDYVSDGLGSTTGVTSSSGVVTDTYAYDVFGALRSQTGSSAQPFRFTGEQEDGDVARDLYYLRARYYDPSLGRLWSRDPFGGSSNEPQTWNLYSYVLNNPVNLIDPSGLDEEQPTPIPAPIAPGTAREEMCDRERDICVDYGRARGIWDAFAMVCNNLYYNCLDTGTFDRADYIHRWGHLPVIWEPKQDTSSVIDWIREIPIDLPNLGTGGILPPDKEGRGFGCGIPLSFGSGWPGAWRW